MGNAKSNVHKKSFKDSMYEHSEYIIHKTKKKKILFYYLILSLISINFINHRMEISLLKNLIVPPSMLKYLGIINKQTGSNSRCKNKRDAQRTVYKYLNFQIKKVIKLI